jgi:putative mRNA 3-end processing factor
MPRRRTRAFSYHAGVTLEGTQLACDAAGSATDLVFLSHAKALEPGVPLGLSPRRAGRRQFLTTEGTLVLLGQTGEHLRPRTLPAFVGRAFNLGGMRLQLVPAGYLPGAASLLGDVGHRRILYAGTIGRACPSGLGPAEVRNAEAVCLDATFGDPRFVLPPFEEAAGHLRGFVENALAKAHAPVLLVSPFGPAPDVVHTLQNAGLAVRAHRSVVQAFARFRKAGLTLPAVRPFSGKLDAKETLLWPPEARESPVLTSLASPVFAFVSGFSVERTAVECMRADQGIALSNQAGFDDLVAYLEATGAQEVALHRGFAETFAEILRGRGFDAYAIDPPRQMELFRG